MRFTIAREKLQDGLTAVTATVPAKTTLPVLANILVETTDRGIRLSGTDLDMAVSTDLTARKVLLIKLFGLFVEGFGNYFFCGGVEEIAVGPDRRFNKTIGRFIIGHQLIDL